MKICKYCKSELLNSTKCSNCSANLESTEIIEIPNLEMLVPKSYQMLRFATENDLPMIIIPRSTSKISWHQLHRVKNTILRDLSILPPKSSKRF